MSRFFVLLTFCLSAFFSHVFADLSHVNQVFFREKGFFPDTWTCPNCGYENFEGITGCAVCGH